VVPKVNRKRKIAMLVLLAILVVSIAPTSAKMYTKHQTSKFIDLAEKAGQRVENLIENINASKDSLDIINATGLLDVYEGNVTLYLQGLQKITDANTSLHKGDYENAIANATEALQIFREVFKSLNIILEQSGIRKGELIAAQGLIVAMQRALERIERLREILPKDADEARELLDNASACLNIDTARIWLSEGRVNETAYNLTQANHLIAKVYQYLSMKAKEMNTKRVRNYLGGATKIMERMMMRLEHAEERGLNVTKILRLLEYGNVTQFRQQLQNMIRTAQEKMNDIKNTIRELNKIHENLQNMEQCLKHLERQHGNGNEHGNKGGKP